MALKIKHLFSAICFCLIVLLCLSSLSWAQRDEYWSNWTENDAYPYEVLWVGSSHVYRTIIPQYLYNEYGVESLSLSTSNQTSWHTYTTLMDFQNLDQLDLIIIDLYAFLRPYTYKESYNHTLSSTQPELIPESELAKSYTFSSAPIRQLAEYQPQKYIRLLGEKEMDVPLQYSFAAFNAHSQFLRMDRSNFQHSSNRFTRCKNYDLSIQIASLEDPFEQDISTDAVFNSQCHKHLMDIILLCKSNRVPLLLTAIPYEVSPEARGVLKQIEQIALENNVDYVDMQTIVEEAMLDWETDFMDPGHTNHYGAQKVSDFFGAYLTEHYDLSDRREDPDPNSPFLDYPDGYYTDEIVENLYRDQQVADYLELLRELDNSYLLMFVTDEGYTQGLDGYAAGLLQELGFDIPDEIPEEGFTLAQIPSHAVSTSAFSPLYASIDAHAIELNAADSTISVDHQIVSSDWAGNKLVIYDLCEHTDIDSISFTTGDEELRR